MSDIGYAGFSSTSTSVNPALSSASSLSAASILSPPCRSLFPLPLVSFPSRPRSSSRRVQQIHARACRVVALANECIRALNTLHFNFPSPRFVPLLRLRSTVPSSAQRRVHNSLLSAAATYFYSCRRLCKQSSTGQPASTRTAPRAGLSPASHAMGADASSSLVILPQRPSSADSAAPRTDSAVSSVIPEPTLGLSSALRAFDSLQDGSSASVGLPSSYDAPPVSFPSLLPVYRYPTTCSTSLFSLHCPTALRPVTLLPPLSCCRRRSRRSAL